MFQSRKCGTAKVTTVGGHSVTMGGSVWTGKSLRSNGVVVRAGRVGQLTR